MTRGGDDDIEGGLRIFFDTPKGGSEKNSLARKGRGGGGFENLYTSKPTRHHHTDQMIFNSTL